ncbi:MAG: hypothetical protein KJP00_08685 [Bacteroidia bacterium]|nr:hypothetical protein [Bacteroidia bacterium]
MSKHILNAPQESKADYTNGIWIVHRNDQEILKIWLSLMTGKEMIYVNDELVTQKRNITSFSTLDTFDYKGDQYDVEIKTHNLAPIKIQISIYRNGSFESTNMVVQSLSDVMMSFDIKKDIDPKDSKERMLDKYLKSAKSNLQEFDLQESMKFLDKSLALQPEFSEAYFMKACIYSLEESVDKAFEYLQLALENKLKGKKRILDDDNLAHIRIHERFESFKTQYLD